jgi:proteasome assembly chaperone (PAC2) family protein
MVVNDPSLIKEVEPYEVGLIEYQGPSSIHTFLLTAFRRKGIPAVSLWGHAPYYIQVENYKVVYALLRRLTKMLGIEINLEDIKVKALYLDEQVNKAISQNPQLESYVKKLEEEFEAIGEYGQPIEGAEEIIKEVEKFLRGQQY